MPNNINTYNYRIDWNAYSSTAEDWKVKNERIENVTTFKI